MITAAEALRLASAKLSPEETQTVEALEAEIDAYVRQHMGKNGVVFDALETRTPIITELQWRLRKAGWQVTTLAMEEQARVSRQKRTVGYRLILSPGDEARRAAEIVASA